MRFLNQQYLKDIYFKGIIPSVLYCIAIWGSCTKSIMFKINNIHLKAARFIQRVKKTVPDSDVLQAANWHSIMWYYKRRTVCITHKLFHGNDPNENLIQKKQISRNLRKNLQIEKRHFKYVKYKDPFNHRSATIWNNLTDNIKNMDFDKFETKITKNAQLIENIDIHICLV